ncbi:MAG: glucoamylase family protein [Pseudomonadota bacterium]
MNSAVVDRLPSLSPFARKLLTSPPETAEPPIRSELFGLHRFEEHGSSLARAQTVDDRPHSAWRGARGAFFPRVTENIEGLRAAYDYIAATSQRGHYVTPAAEWLLDNFHLVEAQMLEIREGVPRRYYAELLKLNSPPLEGLPRVYGIAWAYVAHTDSVFNPAVFSAFLNAYQEVSELRLSELWAMPTTLRVVLLENLRRMADDIAFGKVAREAAHAVWDSEYPLKLDELDQLRELMRERGIERPFLTQMWQCAPALRAEEDPPPVFAWVDRNCGDGPALTLESQAAQVASNLTVSNIITTLRMIGRVEWIEVIEPLSRSLRVLDRLPSFHEESEMTRKLITHAMERIAKRSGVAERTVAEKVVALAQHAPMTATVQQTAGYYLIGPGRGQLDQALGLPRHEAAKPRRDWRLVAYVGAITLATGLVLAAGLLHMPGTGWPWALVFALLALPASETAASFLHRMLAESLRVNYLPRLDFTTGIPQEHRVLVAMPSMLTSAASIDRLVHRLELHWLSNREQQAQFALVTDWADAPTEHAPTDDALLAQARKAIEHLNRRYPAEAGMPDRFLLLHRPRAWCETEQSFLGWERKRGKLEMLVRWLARGDASGFVPLPAQQAPMGAIRYLVTLDSDTGLPPGALRELVSVAAHPLNAPTFDETARRVVAGYAILQPRVVSPLPEDSERTLFHKLFAGQCGIDPYSQSASDVYQDLFGEGNFSGKGLINVHAMHAALDQRLPKESVLSHDLLEGTIARCAYVSDVVLIEDHPSHPAVAASRLHRWTRGDWQLLPLMLRAKRHGIDSLGLWKMTDNLRRSLVLPACCALLVWALFSAEVPLRIVLWLTGGALLAGPLLGSLAGLVPLRRGIAWRHFLAVGLRQLAATLAAAVWQFMQLAVNARLLLDAVVRTMWRLAVSRRRLLEWTTAEQASLTAGTRLADFLRRDTVVSLACLVLMVVAMKGPHPLAAVLIFGAWALAPVLAWASSIPRPSQPAPTPDSEEHRELLAIARDTWRFFERCVTAEDNYLPPDNLQMVPEPTIAHRTSPTNIGLYLLAVHCAREFGWIGGREAVQRLRNTLSSIERLTRHHGHLMNWYDTRTLEVLPPAYLSTVDSGNFAGLLLTVAQACEEAAKEISGPELSHDWMDISARCRRLYDVMDFKPLYDTRRHLFHIGLRVHEDELDPSHYDLLASECRLTSFLAIAKGDVSRRHWTALGRPFLTVGAAPSLKSWSGSMFEYLMPSLVMPEPRGSLIDVAARAAITEQQAFGLAQELPWGVSESAYFAQDHTLAFQYGPFGVPRLALRRTPATDRVIAPYATLMAAMFDPTASLTNLRGIEALGGRGEFGFYESLDFTAARQGDDRGFSLVETFMAHHHGMSLVSLCNLLRDGAPRRWFRASPLVQAHEALLHECTPRLISATPDPRRLPAGQGEREQLPAQAREVDPQIRGWKPTNLLSNGSYSVALRANGAGVSRWRGKHVSRWRDDLARDGHGTFFYLRTNAEAPISLTAQPAPGPGWLYNARFMADRVQFDARGGEISTSVTVVVSPEDDTELRTVAIHNSGKREIRCELVSCFEVALSDHRADEAHPAFSNLFIDTRWYEEWNAMTFVRKPRLAGAEAACAVHMLASHEGHVESVSCIADRRAFLGRHRDMSAPLMQSQPFSAPGMPVNGLDPVASLRIQLRIPPGASARLNFATMAATSHGDLMSRIDTYLQPTHIQRAMRMAATLAQVRLRDLALSPELTSSLQDLTTGLMYTAPRLVADRAAVDQRLLWRFGISGDKPIVLVRIHSANGMPLVHALMRAQSWWNFGGLAVDLVLLNSEPNSYLMPLQRDIQQLRDRLQQSMQQKVHGGEAGGLYVLREQEVTDIEKSAFASTARLVLNADGRPLEVQLAAWREALSPTLVPGRVSTCAAWRASGGAPSQGNFDPATGEYRLALRPAQATPRPWVNVIANPSFGFQVSESGSGYTWAINSRLHQLTRWSNDAVTDPSPEHWLLQDLDTRECISLFPGLDGNALSHHVVRHGQGYSTFETSQNGLLLETTFLADVADPVKLVSIRITNESARGRKLRAVALVEWMMGAGLADRRTVHTWKADDMPVLFARQRQARAGFGGCTGFLALAGGQTRVRWTCDRSEFFDDVGKLVLPDVLGKRRGTGDPASALAHDFELDRGEGVTVVFVLGHATSEDGAMQLARKWAGREAGPALSQVREQWSRLLGAVQVRTPDPAFDALVNRWLLYQTVTCRLWSRAGFYQAGGAYGFRDQLQDAMALAVPAPKRLRDQILLNASRQFPEGDVQHWWHAPGGEGVRTHFSDDLLWLPYATAHYLDVTGDLSILDERVGFLDGPQIPAGAEDAYYVPQQSPDSATLYEHCARTIDRSLKTGAHGLPHMGTGDWNDGMNRVGHEGKGESVWLAWFLCNVVERFAPTATARGELERAHTWTEARKGWIEALHGPAWDGEWFRRAFFDNGAPLGSKDNEECRIDLIAQAWSVLSGASEPQYTNKAMKAMREHLIDRDPNLLHLLAPPLQNSANNPGYIQAYPPGVRENGGQYSHAAVWAMMAQALTGDVDGAWQSFEALSPAHRWQNAARAQAYELEPYVMAGDIYGSPPYVGRGGWSWYTGSAAWLYRASLETLIGLTVRPGAIRLEPRVPSHWPRFEVVLHLGDRWVTLSWRAEGTGTGAAISGHQRQVHTGDWVELDDLPERSTIVVITAPASVAPKESSAAPSP